MTNMTRQSNWLIKKQDKRNERRALIIAVLVIAIMWLFIIIRIADIIANS